MPVIGKFRTGGGAVDTRVTSGQIDTRGAGAIGQAIQGLGKAVTKGAVKVSDVLHKEEVLNYGDKSRSLLQDHITKEEEALGKKYQGTDHKGYTEDLELSIGYERDRLLAEAPTRDAAEYFKRDSRGIYDRSINSSRAKTITESISYSGRLDTELNNKLGQRAYNNPVSATVQADLADRVQKLNLHKNRYNNKQQGAYENHAIKQSRDGLLGGFASNGRNSEGLKFLKDAEGSQIMKNMTPLEMKKWKNTFTQGMKVGQKNYEKKIFSNVGNIIDIIKAKGTLDEGDYIRVLGSIAAVEDGEKRDQLYAGLESAKGYYDVMEMIGTTPGLSKEVIGEYTSKVMEESHVANNLLSDATSAQLENKITKEVIDGYQQALGPKASNYFASKVPEINTHMSIAAATGDPEAFEAGSRMLKTQYDEFGTPAVNQGFPESLTQPISGGYKMAMEEKNSVEAMKILDKVEKMTRGNSAVFLRKSGIPAELSILGEIGQGKSKLENISNRQRAMKNYFGKVDITRSFENHVNKDDDSTINIRLMEEPIYTAYMKRGGNPTTAKQNADAAVEVVSWDYKRRIALGDTKEVASKRAWELFKSSQHVIQGDNANPITVPKKYTRPDRILKSMEAYLPNKNKFFDDPYSVSDQFNLKIDDISTKAKYDNASYEWRDTADGDGVALYMSGEGFVKNVNNNLVIKSFTDLENEQPLNRKGSLDAIRERIQESGKGNVGVSEEWKKKNLERARYVQNKSIIKDIWNAVGELDVF